MSQTCCQDYTGTVTCSDCCYNTDSSLSCAQQYNQIQCGSCDSSSSSGSSLSSGAVIAIIIVSIGVFMIIVLAIMRSRNRSEQQSYNAARIHAQQQIQYTQHQNNSIMMAQYPQSPNNQFYTNSDQQQQPYIQSIDYDTQTYQQQDPQFYGNTQAYQQRSNQQVPTKF